MSFMGESLWETGVKGVKTAAVIQDFRLPDDFVLIEYLVFAGLTGHARACHSVCEIKFPGWRSATPRWPLPVAVAWQFS